MGAFLDKPKTEKHNEKGEGNGLSYGLSSMQGWRVEMEDAHTAVIGLHPALPTWSFFAVFDGHAGASVSAWCSKRLLPSITATLTASHEEAEGSQSAKTAASDPDGDAILGQLASRLEAAVAANDQEGANKVLSLLAEGITQGFLSLDEAMRAHPDVQSGADKSGSTATAVLVTPSHLLFANCGDSRGALSSGGACSFSTHDHKPSDPVEKDRIQRAGGSVMIQRVNGSLAVSRALGDYEYKQVCERGPTEQLVSPEPEVSCVPRHDADDEFVLLACDGIWDVMSSEEACAYVRHLLRLSDDLEWVSNRVIDCCLHKGSRDNMSVEIIRLPGCPSVCQEAKAAEAELEGKLEDTIKALFQDSSAESLDLFNINHHLMNLDLAGLPPGGGLAAKHSEIETIFNRVQKAFSSEEEQEQEPGSGSATGGERGVDVDMPASQESESTQVTTETPSVPDAASQS